MSASPDRAIAVSVVIPVRNGARWLRRVLDAVFESDGAFDLDVIVVDDGSTDGSHELLEEYGRRRAIRVLAGDGRGAAAALNCGIRAAHHALIAQIDQDVVISDQWLKTLTAEMEDASVAAAQGRYAAAAGAGLFGRIAGVDLNWRYSQMRATSVDHVCTGNVVYRASALHQIGLFDEGFGYGYDNDVSYRLRAAGYALRYCADARSTHYWREGLAGYCRQQYGLGYGRLDVVAKHPKRFGGDQVSSSGMMLHPVAMGAALAMLPLLPLVSLSIVSALALERAVVGVRAARRFGDAAALSFPVAHLLRDVVWVTAIAAWLGRRVRGVKRTPMASMRPRSGRPAFASSRRRDALPRVLGLIPSHNEAATLPTVVAALRASCPDLDVLVLDDGSTDETQWVLQDLGVRFLHFPDRMGIGSGMRAGLRYAARMGYDAAVRLDGDGQHDAEEIERLLAPIRRGLADVTIGSRFTDRRAGENAEPRRFVQRGLASLLSFVTGQTVTDPTSGFCAFGPRAVRMLAEHHPTGYPEPELLLLLSRNRLSVAEVAVSSRPRLAGRTSLTAARLTTAALRVLLAIVIVPLRAAVGGADRE